ncbi:MAG: homocysteine S-methyltransferase family protein [Candidatus Promineifilaceae bacterium]|jgi:5-methyltetrahydrofolate--homocysteine methyltransferase
MKTTLLDLLASSEIVIADGAMGSRLMAAGMPIGQAPELWNVENPEAVRDVHRSYVEAGSQIILSNSFGGSRATLGRNGLHERTSELNQAAAENARSVADAAPHPVAVGGSIGPSGEMFAPFGPLDADSGRELFAEQAAALAAGGVDVLWIETMSDLNEVQAAVAGCRQAAPHLPVVTTMSFDRKGRTMMGTTPQQALETLKPLGVIALGGNCGNGPDEVLGVIEKIHALDPAVVLVAKANAGMPRLESGRTIYDAGPQEMGVYAVQARENGARIIGACCGSTADHIRAIAEALR